LGGAKLNTNDENTEKPKGMSGGSVLVFSEGAEVERSEGKATEKNKNNDKNIYARKE
jgi:hypothetical protein